MIQPCHAFDQDWDVFVLGTLEPERDAALLAHLPGCAACLDRYRQSARLLAVLSDSLDDAAPSPQVEARLRRTLATTTGAPLASPELAAEPPRQSWSDALLRLTAAALVIGCSALAWSNWSLRRDLAVRTTPTARPSERPPARPSPPAPPAAQPEAVREAAGLSAERAAWQDERRRLQVSLASAERARSQAEADAAAFRIQSARTAAAPSVGSGTPPAISAPIAPASQDTVARDRVVALTAEVERLQAEARRQGEAARHYAKALDTALDSRSARTVLRPVVSDVARATADAVLGPDGELLLIATGLPPLGKDKCYQLWIISTGSPSVVSGGVLGADGPVVHTTRITGDLRSVTGFAITDEPAGGSVSSRGRKLLFGALR